MKKLILLLYFLIVLSTIHAKAFDDEFAIEETTHLTLLLHSNPKNILLIGDKNILPEIQKYSPKNIKSLSIADIDFVKTTNDNFDIVLINLNSSETIQSNRFYTIEFFNNVKRILNPKGILSIKVIGLKNQNFKNQGRYLSCIKNTLEQVFPSVNVITGDSANLFLGANKIDDLQISIGLLVNNLKKHNISNKYINEYYLLKTYRSMKRVDCFNSIINQAKITQINKDYFPIGYYYYNFNHINIIFFSIAFLIILIYFIKKHKNSDKENR